MNKRNTDGSFCFLYFLLPVFTYRGLAWIYRLPPDKRFEPVYHTVKMAWCSPFRKCSYQPIVITMITNNDYPSKTNGMWSYLFWMHLNSPPYLQYHTSYARPLFCCKVPSFDMLHTWIERYYWLLTRTWVVITNFTTSTVSRTVIASMLWLWIVTCTVAVYCTTTACYWT